MVTPLASRFAVLPIDDDGDTSRRITAKSLNKKRYEQTKPQTTTATGTKKADSNKKQNSKKKTEQPVSAKQKSKPKNETNKKKASQEQWEQWKQRDAEFVDGHYEEDLQQAMLLSKLDYEEKKEFYVQDKKMNDDEKKNAAKKNKKSNKAQPMSLSQFNQMGESRNQPQHDLNEVAGVVNGKHEADAEFFDRIEKEAKKAFKSEQAEEQRKAREPLIDELITVAQYQDNLQKCHEEISRLKEENESLQKELKTVKARHKKMCQLLLQGETKDKAEVMVEVDKLQRVKDELSTEVSSLAAQLEQEKSKVRALTAGDARAKDKKKRTDSK